MARYIELPQYRYKPSVEEMISSLSEMTYKSPVETISQQIQAKFEGDVMELIHSYGINVDKDELIKALQYDREQYEKGFADGCKGRMDTIKAEVAREIFEEIEKRLLPSNTSGEFRGDSIEWFDYYDLHLAEDIAELKKKYTEGEE